MDFKEIGWQRASTGLMWLMIVASGAVCEHMLFFQERFCSLVSVGHFGGL